MRDDECLQKAQQGEKSTCETYAGCGAFSGERNSKKRSSTVILVLINTLWIPVGIVIMSPLIISSLLTCWLLKVRVRKYSRNPEGPRNRHRKFQQFLPPIITGWISPILYIFSATKASQIGEITELQMWKHCSSVTLHFSSSPWIRGTL